MIQISPGFFYITNFGLDQESIDRQFAIGKELFNLPASEKLKYRADLENGGYNGYKPLGLREVRPGIQDNTEIYNIPKWIPELKRDHPDIINAHREEIEKFARHVNDKVVGKLLVLLAIILELPEGFFLEKHRYDERSDCHLRYMKYHKRTSEQNKALDNVWVKGHTDFGSLTLLFRQPVAALQVRPSR
jgi:isopenicillin N synthase-like dioxygenase